MLFGSLSGSSFSKRHFAGALGTTELVTVGRRPNDRRKRISRSRCELWDGINHVAGNDWLLIGISEGLTSVTPYG